MAKWWPLVPWSPLGRPNLQPIPHHWKHLSSGCIQLLGFLRKCYLLPPSAHYVTSRQRCKSGCPPPLWPYSLVSLWYRQENGSQILSPTLNGAFSSRCYLLYLQIPALTPWVSRGAEIFLFHHTSQAIQKESQDYVSRRLSAWLPGGGRWGWNLEDVEGYLDCWGGLKKMYEVEKQWV